jgi:AcrR family transcriptional regulator
VPRAGVTRERVVATATRLANESGLDALTLAAVASDLGVRTPSLYKHVDGLPSLRRLVAVRAKEDLAAVLAAASVGKARGDALRALTAAYRAWASDHPAAAAAAQAAPDPDDPDDVAVSRAATDVVFGALSGYGLTDDALVDATRSLRAGLVGFAALESGGAFGLARPVAASFTWWVDALDRALSAP